LDQPRSERRPDDRTHERDQQHKDLRQIERPADGKRGNRNDGRWNPD